MARRSLISFPPARRPRFVELSCGGRSGDGQLLRGFYHLRVGCLTVVLIPRHPKWALSIIRAAGFIAVHVGPIILFYRHGVR